MDGPILTKDQTQAAIQAVTYGAHDVTGEAGRRRARHRATTRTKDPRMKTTARTRITLSAVLALTVLPAGAAVAQSADCVVVDGSGSAAGDVECPTGGVGGVGVTRPAPGGDVGDEDVSVLPGRTDRPQGAPAGEDADADAAPTVQSADDALAATGVPAAATAAGALAALALGGGALAATRRRQRSES